VKFYSFSTFSFLTNRYEHACRERVFEFMVSELGYEDIATAKATWREVFSIYNQTLKSLRVLGHGDFKKEEYWEFTRGDCSLHLEADEKVRECLEKMSGFPKFVLTNCAETEAKQALKTLNILDQFDHVYGADFMGDTCKPSKEAFSKVLRDIQRRMRKKANDDNNNEEMEDNTIQKPFENDDEVFMFEDSLKNLVSAKDNFNITGVLIKGKTLAEENGAEIAKRFIQIDKPVLSELMEKAPSLFA
jgi:FMN phosphatase YigB (HAD superfamily)